MEGRVGALSSLLGLTRESQGLEDFLMAADSLPDSLMAADSLPDSLMAADTLPVAEISEEVVISDPYWVVGRRGTKIVESRREKTDSGYNATGSSRQDTSGKSREMDKDDTDDFITDFSRHLLDSTRILQSTQGDPARRQGVTLGESCQNISLVPGQRRKGKVDKSSRSKTSSKDIFLVAGISEDVMSQAAGREESSQGVGREGRVMGAVRGKRSNGAVREGRCFGGAGREERSQGAGREERRNQAAGRERRSQGAGRSRAGFGLGDCLALEETSSPERLEVRRRLPKVRVALTASQLYYG